MTTLTKTYRRPRTRPAESIQRAERVVTSAGDPLRPAVRTHMESRFGHDFRQVRVHADGSAAAAAEALNARAFTSGSDIVFAAGEYQTESDTGLGLLAHELSHVVQQSAGTIGGSSALGSTVVEDPALERVAEQQAARVAHDGTADQGDLASAPSGSVSLGGTPIQRETEEDEPFWDSTIFKTLSSAAGFLPGEAGMAAKILRHPFQATRGMEAAVEGDALTAFRELGGAATSVAGAGAAMGGFSALGTGGLSGAISAISSGGLGTLTTVGGLGSTAGLTMPASAAVTGGGLSGVAALGPGALVAGAGLAGLGIGSAIAENTGVDEWMGDRLFDALGPEPGLWLADTFGL